MFLKPPVRHRILLIDGDVAMTQALSEYLSLDLFQVTVVHNGLAATQLLAREAFDATLLGLVLPDSNGMDILRRYRQYSQRPVIILSSDDNKADCVLGLESGADDYLFKPFEPREIKARIRAVLRRVTDQSSTADALRFGPLSYRPTTGNIYWNGEVAALTGAEHRLLALLLRVPGQIVSRQDLASYALGHRSSVYERSIQTHISNIRRKLGLDRPDAPVLLRNLRGRGYMLAIQQPD